MGKIGVLVALESAASADVLTQLGKQIAMHVASANPVAVDSSGVDPATIQREKDILADKFKAQGKPAAMIDKIVESGIKTYFKEVTLLEQPFIFDDKKSVAQALKEAEGKVGGPIKITGFVRFKLGEGVEKQEADFAAEVAAASGVKN
jgi:elongation factor Ts